MLNRFSPSHSYVGAAEAASLNLTFSTESTFVMRTDFSSVVTAGARGRKSVRLASKKTYTAVSSWNVLAFRDEVGGRPTKLKADLLCFGLVVSGRYDPYIVGSLPFLMSSWLKSEFWLLPHPGLTSLLVAEL